MLELSPDEGAEYRCRGAANACERQKDGLRCEADPDCVWEPGSCFCDPEANTPCACGGGPPPWCRRRDTPPTCRPQQPFCAEGTSCCVQGQDPLGRCLAGWGCGPDGPLDACTLRLTRKLSGGLCQEGPCLSELRLQGAGYLFLDDQTYATPVDGWISPAAAPRLEALLGELAALPLADAYGPCCNADSDGADEYLFFYAAGALAKHLRISRRVEAPAALRQLLELLDGEEVLLRQPGAMRPAACPGLDQPPLHQEMSRPAPSCAATAALAATFQGFVLYGPRGQQVGNGALRVEGMDPSLLSPVTLRLSGQVAAVPPGGNGFALRVEDGSDWRLEWGRPPGLVPVPEPCLVLGQRIELSLLANLAFETYEIGLLVRDARGVLFVVDVGLAGVAGLPESPFRVEVGTGGCAPQPEIPEVAQPLQLTFVAGPTRLELFTGAWGRLPVPGGYDLWVRDLGSFSSSIPDDGGHVAYFGMAIPGSALAGCGGP